MVPKQQTVAYSRVDNSQITGPDLTVVDVVNSVNILPDFILFVNFHSIAFICNDNFHLFHKSSSDTANLHVAFPTTNSFHASPSAIVADALLLSDWLAGMEWGDEPGTQVHLMVPHIEQR